MHRALFVPGGLVLSVFPASPRLCSKLARHALPKSLWQGFGPEVCSHSLVSPACVFAFRRWSWRRPLVQFVCSALPHPPGAWGHSLKKHTAAVQKFLRNNVKQGNPFHPIESSRLVEYHGPVMGFRFLNLKPGDSNSAKRTRGTSTFRNSWRRPPPQKEI